MPLGTTQVAQLEALPTEGSDGCFPDGSDILRKEELWEISSWED